MLKFTINNKKMKKTDKKNNKKTKIENINDLSIILESMIDKIQLGLEATTTLSQHLDRFEVKFDNLEGRLDTLKGRFDLLEKNTNQRFDKLEEKTDMILKYVENIDKEVQKVKLSLKNKVDTPEFETLRARINKLEKEISTVKHKLKIA